MIAFSIGASKKSMTSQDQEMNAEVSETAASSAGPEPAGQDAGLDAVTPEVDQVAKLTTELNQCQAQKDEYLDSWRRATAELANARRRMQREQAEFAVSANARLLEKLLPIIDDVDRAFAVLPLGEADTEWVNGFRLIQRKLQALLESEGVTAVLATGQKFDPAVHYAVSHEEHDGFSEGDVIGEVAKGYKLGDKVLRPAMVRVAKG
jgi:molecular chaperone GrpE